MTRRHQLPALAVLVLAACPVLASQPTFQCATLTAESFTADQFAALERNAPVLHQYLTARSFHALDARQRFHLVSRATTTGATDWYDIELPAPYHVAAGEDPAKREILMSAYMAGCDRALGAYVLTLAAMELPARLIAQSEALLRHYETQDGHEATCEGIERCVIEKSFCLSRAKDTRANCDSAADEQLAIDLQDCETEYDRRIAAGMHPNLSAVFLELCVIGAHGDHFGAKRDCEGEHIWNIGVCQGEFVECMAKLLPNPF